MDVLKGIGKAVLIAICCVVLPILLVVVGMALTIIGPILGVILIFGLPAISLGVLIGVRQMKDK